MPVDRKKKDTTANAADSTQKQSAPTLPTQQEFQQYLRELARSAIRVVLESVMREELDALIGVGWGESSRQQQGLSQRLLHPRAFSQRRDPLRSCRCPEIARVSSTRRSLSAIAAMNRRWPRGSARCSWPGQVRIRWEKWPKR